ncbi:uncharacterized protein TRIADDRAFT_56945 [Trichoplax adhaerens]|uniref:Ubiquitin carboxyl-terminal hydrolase n=1 Tax=Trichoplax adhaerens TaxID=10228 RepID=B3RX01_TRIAD|nr:hypothetical protein TRIADDRAFT_56945 [Trichoplax adhaerens]EDV24782.1 hypothetical protein TRIADDRAFT_56945 [Trichoplax adhaerens]|eukprot:XP_002112672.1 hypothetical protein TRIADDRAFT_56945 [Trichoplax adhaerens]
MATESSFLSYLVGKAANCNRDCSVEVLVRPPCKSHCSQRGATRSADLRDLESKSSLPVVVSLVGETSHLRQPCPYPDTPYSLVLFLIIWKLGNWLTEPNWNMIGKKFDVQVDEDWQQDQNQIVLLFKFGKIAEEISRILLGFDEKEIIFYTEDKFTLKKFKLYDSIRPKEFDTDWDGDRLKVTLTKTYFNYSWIKLLSVENERSNAVLFNGDAKEKNITLSYLSHDWKDSNEDLEMSITVFIKNLIKKDLDIDFGLRNLRVKFRTRDNAFLSQHPNSSETTTFIWEIYLCHTILPSKSSYSPLDDGIQIIMHKEVAGLWHNLEQALYDRSISKGQPIFASIDIPLQILRNSQLGDYDDAVNDLKIVRDGMTGLNNLGNTCFMNSILQCMSNTRPLRDFFLECDLRNEINYDNPLGSKGAIVAAFAVLIRTLWCGKYHSYSPSKLKSLVAAKATQFMGYAQQDAQEFMAYLLDGLHEDLNRVRNKPLTQVVEGAGRPDEEVANEAWMVHRKRNDSLIVDYFFGQFKSVLICPECDKKSTTFDPFMVLPLPIPAVKVPIKVIPVINNFPGTGIQKTFMVEKGATVRSLKVEISLWIKDIHPNDFVLIGIYADDRCKLLTDKDQLSYMTRYDVLYACDCRSDSPVGKEENVIKIPLIQRVLRPPSVHKCNACYKDESNGNLKRCSKCESVAYCDLECQRKDWEFHKRNCARTPTVIGLPAILAIPETQLSLPNLLNEAFKVGIKSVTVYKDDVEMTTYSADEMDIKCPESAPFTLVPAPIFRLSAKDVDFYKENGDVNIEDIAQFYLDWNNSHNQIRIENRSAISSDYEEGIEFDKTTMLYDCLKLFTVPEILLPEEACGLDLRDFISDSASTNSNESYIYDLYAVVNHYGGLMGGHYTAFARFPLGKNGENFSKTVYLIYIDIFDMKALTIE